MMLQRLAEHLADLLHTALLWLMPIDEE